MNARGYLKQAHDEIPDDKSLSLSTYYVWRFNTVLSINVKKDKMDAMPNLLMFV